MEYCTLLRTRLSDLNAHKNLEWMSTDKHIFNGIMQKSNANNIKSKNPRFPENGVGPMEDPAVADVEKALESFKANKKIPQVVLEASIFRRPYFIGQFLPSLVSLSERAKIDRNGRMQLISDFVETLKSKGKIPPQLVLEFDNKS